MPSRSPLFSVLIANFNRGSYIAECLESVARQTYSNFEIVIVDDGSTDNSLQIIKQFSEADPRARFFQNEKNEGCGATMRKCAAYASGEIMGYLGSDDLLLPNAVETMVEAHLKYPECSLIYSSHYVCNERLEIQRLAFGALEIPSTESFLSFGKGVTSFATFTYAHYKLTEGVASDFKRAVDHDLYYKLEEVGKLYFVDKPLYLYRVNDSGISTLKNISKARYWSVQAKENAYHRRLLRPTVKNLNKKELDGWWSVLYVSKSSVAFQRFQICRGFYWLIQSLRKSVFDRHFKLKAQSFFINTILHRAYTQLNSAWKKRF